MQGCENVKIKNNRKYIYLLFVFVILFTIMLIVFENKIDSKKDDNKEYADSFYIDWDNKKNVEFKDGNKYNNSKKIANDHIYKQFEFVDMKIYTDNGLCNVDFKVVNLDYKNDIQDYGIFIKFLDNNSNIIYVYYYVVPNDLKINETKEESFSLNVDVSNAYDYSVGGFRELQVIFYLQLYIIFNDATMDALVNMRPKNLKQLGRVPGFAAKKIEMYGNDIIKIINNR